MGFRSCEGPTCTQWTISGPVQEPRLSASSALQPQMHKTLCSRNCLFLHHTPAPSFAEGSSGDQSCPMMVSFPEPRSLLPRATVFSLASSSPRPQHCRQHACPSPHEEVALKPCPSCPVRKPDKRVWHGCHTAVPSNPVPVKQNLAEDLRMILFWSIPTA